MTYMPQTLKDCRTYLKFEDGDLSDVELGIVGGPSHILAGTSYHLGKDQLKMFKNPYSARTARDKAGLADPEIANAACALDIDDDLDELRELSVWIVAECRRGAPDTLDIREVIYSPDGITVFTWDREKGVNSLPERRGDSSHLGHTHVSRYRDATRRALVNLFKRFYAERTQKPQGDDMFSKFGEGENPATPLDRVAVMQDELVAAGGDLTPFGGVDGRYGNGTAQVMIQVLGPEVAGDGKTYGWRQHRALHTLVYGTGPGGVPPHTHPAGKVTVVIPTQMIEAPVIT